jgi:hypothetical protein
MHNERNDYQDHMVFPTEQEQTMCGQQEDNGWSTLALVIVTSFTDLHASQRTPCLPNAPVNVGPLKSKRGLSYKKVL